MSYQQEKFQEIADKIREKTGTYDAIKPSEFADKLTDVFDAGKKAEYDRFWDIYQGNGNLVSSYMFYGPGWTDDVYNPKYPIVFNTTANAMFGMTKITSTKVDISVPLSGVIQLFYGATSLKTIPSLTVSASTTFSSWFVACTNLESITVNGTIANTISFYASPLNQESVENVVSALSDTVTGQTVTFNDSKIEAINGGTSWWTDLKATKPNWKFELA